MISLDRRLDRIRSCSSDPNAYACLQPGLRYFDHPHGFISYRKALSGNVVLGDPMAEPHNSVELISDFLQKHPKSVFSYLSDSAATALLQASKKQMHFAHLGFELALELPYTMPYSKAIQGALKKAGKVKLSVLEQKLAELQPTEIAHFEKINQQFIRSSPAGKEIGFISRAVQFAEEPDVRFFSISTETERLPIGFCVLDPWYQGARLERYQLHQFRLGPTKLWGVYLSVVALLIEKLQAEGVVHLSLGACIDANAAGKPELPTSKVYSFCRDTTLRLADRYHPLTNLSKNKLEFSGTTINRYFAAPHKLPIVPLLRFAKANNMSLLPKW